MKATPTTIGLSNDELRPSGVATLALKYFGLAEREAECRPPLDWRG